MPWTFFSDLWFHDVLQATIIKQITKRNEEIEKYIKNRWDCEEIFMCASVCVCV